MSQGEYRVISILQHDGYTMVAVQNPLSSFAAEMETTKRMIGAFDSDAVRRPVVAAWWDHGHEAV